MRTYHDCEWGLPEHNDRVLFELLTLEGAQAGLSWRTVLVRRGAYRDAFAGLVPAKVAQFDERDESRLRKDSRIIRHRGKIHATVLNARAFARVQEEFGSFSRYLWAFVSHQPIDGQRRNATDVPTQTATSRALSRDLSQRGFSFVGPTICYAYMQAAGLVNDHVQHCFRYQAVSNIYPATD